jgi:hypothetical protein
MITLPEHVALTQLHERLTAAVKAVPTGIHPLHTIDILADLLAYMINQSLMPNAVEAMAESIERSLHRRVMHYQRQTTQEKQVELPWPTSQERE